MARKVTVVTEDDLDGGPADETLQFGFEGINYEIDLSASNARAFRTVLAPFIECARTPRRRTARRAGTTLAGRHRSADARAWAKAQGIAIASRGRIPTSVIEQYQAATKGR